MEKEILYYMVVGGHRSRVFSSAQKRLKKAKSEPEEKLSFCGIERYMIYKFACKYAEIWYNSAHNNKIFEEFLLVY